MTIYRRVHEGKQLKDECNLCGKHVYNLGKCDNLIGYIFFFFGLRAVLACAEFFLLKYFISYIFTFDK